MTPQPIYSIDELRAAADAGQLIQANRGTVEAPNWVTLADPQFTCEPHLYRISPDTTVETRRAGTCESGAPDCGPAVFEDDDGVPLCRKCYDELETETGPQRRMRESGLSVVTADEHCKAAGKELDAAGDRGLNPSTEDKGGAWPDDAKQALGEYLTAELPKVAPTIDWQDARYMEALVEGAVAALAAAAPQAPVGGEWVATLQKAIERARVFDDGSDGADAESAQSVVALLEPLLAAAPPALTQPVDGDES